MNVTDKVMNNTYTGDKEVFEHTCRIGWHK